MASTETEPAEAASATAETKPAAAGAIQAAGTRSGKNRGLIENGCRASPAKPRIELPKHPDPDSL